MSTTIKYTYLKQQTWLYRRNYPRELQGVLGAQALKQSLKTGDAKLAKARSAEVNAKYEEIVRKARQGIVAVHGRKATPVRIAPAVFWTTGPVVGRDNVAPTLPAIEIAMGCSAFVMQYVFWLALVIGGTCLMIVIINNIENILGGQRRFANLQDACPGSADDRVQSQPQLQAGSLDDPTLAR